MSRSTSVIHENVDIHPTAQLGEYCIVYPDTIIKNDVTIDDHAIIGKPPHTGRNQMDIGSNESKTIIGSNTYVGSQSIIYQGSKIGNHNYLADRAFIRENVEIDCDVVIGTNVTISYNAEISSGVKIMTGTNIGGNMKIGKDSFIGVQVTSFNDNTPSQSKNRDKMTAATIGANVMIGSNATLFPDIEIGSGVTVGAGAVVTQTIQEKNGIYIGIPAKIVRRDN